MTTLVHDLPDTRPADVFVCVTCRRAWRHRPVCDVCGDTGVNMGPVWTPPRPGDAAGWELVVHMYAITAPCVFGEANANDLLRVRVAQAKRQRIRQLLPALLVAHDGPDRLLLRFSAVCDGGRSLTRRGADQLIGAAYTSPGPVAALRLADPPKVVVEAATDRVHRHAARIEVLVRDQARRNTPVYVPLT